MLMDVDAIAGLGLSSSCHLLYFELSKAATGSGTGAKTATDFRSSVR
jgi:hypothetical protein